MPKSRLRKNHRKKIEHLRKQQKEMKFADNRRTQELYNDALKQFQESRIENRKSIIQSTQNVQNTPLVQGLTD